MQSNRSYIKDSVGFKRKIKEIHYIHSIAILLVQWTWLGFTLQFPTILN